MRTISFRLVRGRGIVLVDALSRRIPLVSDQPTIIFGVDVTHPHPGEDSSPSIAVARQELIQDMFKVWQDSQQGTLTGGMIKISAMQYLGSYLFPSKRLLDKSLNGLYSTRMDVFVLNIPFVFQACASLEPNYQPLVTFAVVQKCHHTILFANNHGDHQFVDKSGNILPRIVVDSKIGHPTEFNFYLCSHASIQVTHLTNNTFCMMYLFK
ncbi:hypothetical protein ZIOFF_021668 [Zingiber officinale]|uniref:Piwi domain-containing protein n=1 Tax=Zingiber officinale TaxID=94328 RepID=A0A8J5H7C7_ZINOF|nr:hypothetical protein ZIOFF_021668 [Zingiber officinale]